MEHLNEHSIELYVLKRTIFDAETRQIMEEHLKTCRVCAAIERDLRAYYEELHSTPRSTSMRLRLFADKIAGSETVIPLQLYKHEGSADISDSRYITVLAAHSSESSPYRFKPAVVYSSPDQKIVVRILQDAAAGNFKLYVMGEEQERCGFAVVSFPELQLDLGTDEFGHMEFSLPDSKRPADWRDLHAFVRLRRE